MVRVVDMECNMPSGSGPPQPAEATTPPDAAAAGHGMANYARIFRSRREGRSNELGMSLDDFAADLKKTGIVRAVPFGPTNEETAELLRSYPDSFIGNARVNPFDGMRAVREFERLVREEGFRLLGISALNDKIPASDRRYYPLYAKAVELGVPARIYSTMNYATDRPYDLGHPRNLDAIAVDFPELTIIGALAGWPWVNEIVAIARRHPNVYIDTSAHRPKYFAQKGSGWEMFLQFGNTLIQDKVLVGLSAGLIGQERQELIEEYLDLPLKDAVKEKWLYGNAARVFGID